MHTKIQFLVQIFYKILCKTTYILTTFVQQLQPFLPTSNFELENQFSNNNGSEEEWKLLDFMNYIFLVVEFQLHWIFFSVEREWWRRGYSPIWKVFVYTIDAALYSSLLLSISQRNKKKKKWINMRRECVFFLIVTWFAFICLPQSKPNGIA